jgi:hypothetical protein
MNKTNNMKTNLLAFLLIINATCFAQYKTFQKNIYVKFRYLENKSNQLNFDVDSMLFTFSPDQENFWGVNIKNLSTKKINVEWGMASFGIGDELHPIVFSSDTRMTMPIKKTSEAVYPKTSIDKKVDRLNAFENPNFISKLYLVKYIKNGHEWPLKMVIPITIDQKTNDYAFDFIVYYKK